MVATYKSNMHKVLVLNRSYVALNVISARRAMKLLNGFYANGEPKAYALGPAPSFDMFSWSDWSALKPKDGENWIETAAYKKIVLPKIIRLSQCDKMPIKTVSFNRRTLWKRDNFRCQYATCKNPNVPGDELTIDHIIPKSRGGGTSWENCVLACVACNSKKADRTPAEAGMKLRRQPFKPTYQKNKFHNHRVDDWQVFIGERYWETELENDMGE